MVSHGTAPVDPYFTQGCTRPGLSESNPSITKALYMKQHLAKIPTPRVSNTERGQKSVVPLTKWALLLGGWLNKPKQLPPLVLTAGREAPSSEYKTEHTKKRPCYFLACGYLPRGTCHSPVLFTTASRLLQLITCCFSLANKLKQQYHPIPYASALVTPLRAHLMCLHFFFLWDNREEAVFLMQQLAKAPLKL